MSPTQIPNHRKPPAARVIPIPMTSSLYAMQLLPGEDAGAITRHLEQCADCRGELARINGDLATYALTVDLESPAAPARQRLLKQVAREKKIVPIAKPRTGSRKA